MDSSLCSSSPPPEPVACEVPCSRDCVLSDWTPWSTCSQTCSSKNIEGKQMRTRSILAYNAGEGEPSSSASRAAPGAAVAFSKSSSAVTRPGVWISHLSALCIFVLISNSLLICAADYFCWSVSSPDTHFLSPSAITSRGLNAPLFLFSFFFSSARLPVFIFVMSPNVCPASYLNVFFSSQSLRWLWPGSQ